MLDNGTVIQYHYLKTKGVTYDTFSQSVSSQFKTLC